MQKEFQLTLQGSEKTKKKKNQYQQSSYNFYRVNKLLDTRLYVSIKMYLNIPKKKKNGNRKQPNTYRNGSGRDGTCGFPHTSAKQENQIKTSNFSCKRLCIK